MGALHKDIRMAKRRMAALRKSGGETKKLRDEL